MSEEIKTYIITDTHFYHDRMVKFCGRPEDHTERIIKQWQNTVSPQDIVYHLGDVIWGNQEQLKAIMARLPGTKILVKGNHDRCHTKTWFIKAGFAAVMEKAQVSGAILSHFPAILGQAEIEFGLINVFGHFHNNPTCKWEQLLKDRLTDNHYLLVLEDVGYRPVSLKDIRRRKFVKNAKKMMESESG